MNEKERRFLCFLYKSVLKLCRQYDNQPILKYSLINPRNTKSSTMITRGWTRSNLGQYVISKVFKHPKAFFYTPHIDSESQLVANESLERICKDIFRNKDNLTMNTNDVMEVCFGVQSEMNITSDKVQELFLSQKKEQIESTEEKEDEIGKYVTFNILNTTDPKKYNILLSHPMLSSPVYERTAYVLPDNRQRFAVILGKRAHELKKKKKKKKSKQPNSKKTTIENNVTNNTEEDEVVFDIEKLTDPNDPNLLKSRIPLSIEPVTAPELPTNNEYDEDGDYNDFDEDVEIYEDNSILEESLINMAVNQTIEEQSKRYVDNLVEELEAKQRLATWRKGQLASEIQHGTWLVVTVNDPTYLVALATSKSHWEVWEYIVKSLSVQYPELASWLDFPYEKPLGK